MTMNIMETYCLKYSFRSFCMITSKDSDFLVGLIIPKYNTIKYINNNISNIGRKIETRSLSHKKTVSIMDKSNAVDK